MKCWLLFFVVVTVTGIVFAHADDNIANAQNRLKTEGFYFGKATGVLDRETADALARFQMDRGLAISGKLDKTTAKALRVSLQNPQPAPAASPTPQVLAGSWRRLPSGEMQFEEASAAPSSGGAAVASASSPAPQLQAPPPAEGPTAAPSVAENRPPPSLPSKSNARPPQTSPSVGGAERFRDYVEAFIVAGLARPAGSEIKFFGERVDYLGTPNSPREEIQRDLIRYNEKWPHRRFWMDGDIQIEPQGANEIKLTFPLRYELRNGSRYASGRVMKSLTLLKTADNELQIVAVSEWKAP